ncbi:MAG: GNAT family N-acetyltransferase [Bradymonadaceae bacterium]
MRALSYDALLDERSEFDRLVDRTPDIDRFCSSSYWSFSAFETLFADHEAWIRRAEDVDGYVALAHGRHPHIGNYLQPFEASWGLASPFVAGRARPLIREFVREIRDPGLDWNMLFLSGLFEQSPQFRELVRRLRPDYELGIGPQMARNVASLEGGFEDYLARRSSKFRSNLRRSRRRAEEAGLETEYRCDLEAAEAVESVFERILDVERHSWKADQGTGILDSPMRDFYERMVPMLGGDGALRVSFVVDGGTDVAYCFGGVTGDLYRGLQLSYHDEYADYSPGNLAQITMIEGLCREGIETYDMGQAMEYKERWAEAERESLALIVRR